VEEYPIFDPKAIRRLEEWGGRDLPKKMIDIFLRDTPSRMNRIEKGVEDQDPGAVEAGAHSLKSSAGNLGAYRLQALLQEVEEAAADGDLTRVARRLAELRDLFDQTLDALNGLKKGIA
jgi:HPt (histidine-containing phosphotransfer) domain-containing protein